MESLWWLKNHIQGLPWKFIIWFAWSKSVNSLIVAAFAIDIPIFKKKTGIPTNINKIIKTPQLKVGIRYLNIFKNSISYIYGNLQ